MNTKEIPEILFETREQWRQWLSENNDRTHGIWMVYYKKSSGKPHLSYDEAVEEALCFGWIDSKPNTLNEEMSKQYYAPRNPKSNWSKLNKTRVAQLIESGKMTNAGMKMIDLAKKTGTWDALNDVDNLFIPDDLQAALTSLPEAEKHFNAFPASTKKGILEWILNAKTIETRMKRIIETATLAAQNIRANQYVKK
jgi:uncharacterized protein YdeI (YjbR/CyaY-like superfamily)